MPYDMINTDSEFYEHNFYGLRKHFIKPRFCYRIIYSKIEIQIFDLISKFLKWTKNHFLFFKKIYLRIKWVKKYFFGEILRILSIFPYFVVAHP